MDGEECDNANKMDLYFLRLFIKNCLVLFAYQRDIMRNEYQFIKSFNNINIYNDFSSKIICHVR